MAIHKINVFVCLLLQSCTTLCNPMDCRLPGSSLHEIFQARILEWVAMPSSWRSSQPRDWIQVSWIAESACNAGDPGSIPGLGRSTGEGIGYPLQYSWASRVAQQVKNLPAMLEIQVWSLGQEESLEMEMATHSRILPWEIPWTEEPGRLQSTGSQRIGHNLLAK